VLLITIYITPSEVIITPTLPNKSTIKIVKTSNNAVMPIGHQINQMSPAIRDPFAIPPEYKEQMDPIQPTNSNNVPTTIGQITTPAKAKNLAKLTGIVSTNNQSIAVIQTANKSKAYYLNEFIGTYQLIAILEDAIILRDKDNQLVLPLESARPKGRQ